MKNMVSFIMRILTSLMLVFINTPHAYSHPVQSRTELPLVVVVCSYNNSLWVEKNLDSIFMQDYTNFRVIYVDDASPDGTAKLVKEYRKKHHLEDKITLQANKERLRKTKNIYNNFHNCHDDEIIVIVDGDDWLEHPDVFSQINRAYLYGDVWLTWGQFKMSEKLTRGWGQPVPESLIETNDFREFTWVYGAPRTFYAWLFKQVKLEDFIGLTVQGFEGKFYPSCDDFAMMYPMLEMAHDHIAFIPENAYIVNQYNPLSTSHAKPADPIVSMQTACEVKMYKKRYEPLEEPISHVVEKLQESKADVVLLSTNPAKTASLLSSMRKFIENVESVLVVTEGSTAEFIQNSASEVAIKCLALPVSSSELRKAISELPCDHLLIMNDEISLTKKVNCRLGIIDLERTGALGCYYQVSPKILDRLNAPYQHIRDNLYAWKINLEGNHALQEHGADMSLYRKKDIMHLIATKNKAHVTDFVSSLPKRSTNLHAIGICYDKAYATSSNLLAKPFTLEDSDYRAVDFDKAMYATERHKEIYKEILGSDREAAFVNVLRDHYNRFFTHPPYSVVPKIPKIIHHIWLGGPMPEQYIVWRQKWQAMHPDWVFMLWTDKEVAHFHLENQEYYDETTSYGEKANLLRYELLYQFGGLYVDTDCECFRPFDLLHHCCDFYAGCEYPQRSYAGSKIMVGNSIMASRPGHPMVKEFIDCIQKTWKEELQVARSGTRYATNIIKKTLFSNEHDTIMIFPANIFYPWASSIDPWEQPVTDQETFVQPETWSLHYWHFTWKPKSNKKTSQEKPLHHNKEHTYSKDKKHSKGEKKQGEKKRLLKKRECKG